MTVWRLLAGLLMSVICLAACRADRILDAESRRATDALRTRCGALGIEANSIPTIRAVLENEAEQDGKYVSAIRYEVESEHRLMSGLTFGSVGVGNSVEDARSTATEEWMFLFADPYCAATASAGGIRLGMLTFYPSRPGFRGSAPSGWLTEPETRHGRILEAIASGLAPIMTNDVGLVDLKIAVQTNGDPDGECRVNGSANSEVCNRLLAIVWPGGTYMYKQVFIYRQTSVGLSLRFLPAWDTPQRTASLAVRAPAESSGPAPRPAQANTPRWGYAYN
jgi:hypothetical protein